MSNYYQWSVTKHEQSFWGIQAVKCEKQTNQHFVLDAKETIFVGHQSRSRSSNSHNSPLHWAIDKQLLLVLILLKYNSVKISYWLDSQMKKTTWPGGRIASNLSTPNIPKLDSVKVPTNHQTSGKRGFHKKPSANAQYNIFCTWTVFIWLELLHACLLEQASPLLCKQVYIQLQC